MNSPCICTHLRLTARKISAIYDAALKPLGINIAQYSMLRIIGDRKDISLTELGILTELERSTVGRNVRVLERLGLVEAGRGELDQREASVSLTRSGRALMRKALPIWKACQQDISSRLGPSRIKALIAINQEI
jgi:DNA-binding MarR family transcriptional regulator